MAGRFCAHCGEERVTDHSWAMSHFFHDVVHEFVHIDSKIAGTFWTLLRYPGLLTADYWRGRRTVWIRPLRLFIVIAAIHLLAVSNVQLRLEMFQEFDYSGVLTRNVGKLAAAHGMAAADVAAVVSARMGRIFAVAQYFSVALFALAPMVLYRRRSPWYAQHLIFSLHLYCFYFLFTSLTFQLLPVVSWVRAPLLLVTVGYLFFMLRRLYGEPAGPALGKALLLRVAHVVAETAALGISLSGALFWTHYSLPR
ncbi:MAG: DUF3667 domain-containing protein [Bryobacterales bacterium]|nr:DUF3667 domain-containing protein [Bryobacterales bacterium]